MVFLLEIAVGFWLLAVGFHRGDGGFNLVLVD
jgi:hypothetical protein